ncbi:hypothetical protein FRC09_006272 [Ceratobasidium sp. 395]|nr:hypothetical protein FRC09_006272 [Ceratobasidium sp. 395]
MSYLKSKKARQRMSQLSHPTSSQYAIDASDYIEVLVLGKPVNGEDEAISAPRGNGEYFEVEVSDGMISDRPAASNKAPRPPKLSPAEHLPPTKRQKVDFKQVTF